MARREGDWDCPTCGMLVFASKSACPRCERGGGGPTRREGDWDCPTCGALVFASKSACPKCEGGGGGGGPGGPGMWKDGDWECPSCGNHCFASKSVCFKCNEPKPGLGAPARGAGTAAARAGGETAAMTSPGDPIKALAKMSPEFKKAWIAYCKWHGQPFTDPGKCEKEFIADFAEYAAGLINEDVASSTPAPAATKALTPAATKRPASTPAAAEPPAKKKLTMKKAVADEIRRLNADGGLFTEISKPKVAASLAELDEGTALELLSELEGMKDEVEDPNGWINERAVELAE